VAVCEELVQPVPVSSHHPVAAAAAAAGCDTDDADKVSRGRIAGGEATCVSAASSAECAALRPGFYRLKRVDLQALPVATQRCYTAPRNTTYMYTSME